MPVTPQISFRNVEETHDVGPIVRDKVSKLELLCDRISSCEVMVEAPHRRHQKGTLYHVRVRLAVPGAELVVGRDPVEATGHQDVLVAVRDAFDAIRRQLQDHMGRSRHR